MIILKLGVILTWSPEFGLHPHFQNRSAALCICICGDFAMFTLDLVQGGSCNSSWGSGMIPELSLTGLSACNGHQRAYRTLI